MNSQSCLFSENLGIAQNDVELVQLHQQYPKYDKTYICQATATDRAQFKKFMEDMWLVYGPFADANFQNDLKLQYAQRSWELYLGATLLSNGLFLGPHSSHGPDFDVREMNSSGRRLCWIEAIATEKGANNSADSVPPPPVNTFSNYPENEILLRIANALSVKNTVREKYLNDGIVKSAEPFVIALNIGKLDQLDPEMPIILKAVFGIGHYVVYIDKGTGKRSSDTPPHWQHRPFIQKANGSQVSMEFLLDAENSGISAVLYCPNYILHSPGTFDRLGSNYVLVHNPLATNPLPKGVLPCGQEWIYDIASSTANRTWRKAAKV